MVKLFNFSVQNKQNKKATFFMIFYKLIFFLRRVSHKNLQIHCGRVEIVKNIQSAFTDLHFLTRNGLYFEKDYKITVVDKTLISNM